jgi:hypothetical protein
MKAFQFQAFLALSYKASAIQKLTQSAGVANGLRLLTFYLASFVSDLVTSALVNLRTFASMYKPIRSPTENDQASR